VDSTLPPGTPPIRVLIVARQPIARAGLRGLLGDLGDVAIVGVTTGLREAATAAAEARPDVALAAWDGGEVEAIVALAESLGGAGTALILVGDAPPPSDLTAVLRAGARGVLLSEVTSDELGATIRAVARGLLVLPPVLARGLVARAAAGGATLEDRGPDAGPEQPLTEREREVLQLLALGLPNKTIARRLSVSEHTVKFHVGSLLAKLAAGSRTEAVTRAARMGLVTL
jgi:DNA-binding NarL/FixJ family response regulator